MKAKNLKIGNLFIDEKTKTIIKVIGLTEEIITFSGHFKNDWQAKPIPLTEEWLLKTQCHVNETGLAKYFNYGLNDYTKVTLMMCNDKGKGEFYVMIHQEDEVVSIPKRMFFVHDWQNLFFAFTGTELEFKQDVSVCS
jgi:hypothetical protein